MKTANNCYQAKAADIDRRWWVVDATDQVLGRLAVKIATVLTGKHKPTYTPHVDTGDFVIVLNAGKVRVTGAKESEIVYQRYSRYPSGLKEIPLKDMLQRHPERALREAVRRMMPKNALAKHMLLKLKLYSNDQHPHQAQMPEKMSL
jgi:large subunit ribosomal protein L13